MSQYREQSQVGRFTPRPHFIVITIAQHAHYKAESEAACRVNVLKLVSPNQPDWVRVRIRVRVRVRVGAWMSQHREQSQVGRFTPRPHFIVITIAQCAQLGLGLGLSLIHI